MDDQTPRARMRAADTDREQVAEQLRSAHAEGRLDLAEYDERVQQAWAARTYGELEQLTADLPDDRSRPLPAALPAPQQDPPVRNRHSRAWQGAVTAWLSVSLINLMIWAIVSLANFELIYPWWIWVAGPWGAVLFAHWIAGRAGGSHPPR